MMSSLFTVSIRPSLADGFQWVTEYVPYRELSVHHEHGDFSRCSAIVCGRV